MAWIRIQIQGSSGSGWRFLSGSRSGFNEYGSETLQRPLPHSQSHGKLSAVPEKPSVTFDGGQLASLGVPALVDLAVGPVAHHLNQVEDTRRVLQHTIQR